jgi:hypothetical protein
MVTLASMTPKQMQELLAMLNQDQEFTSSTSIKKKCYYACQLLLVNKKQGPISYVVLRIS